ncbi:Cytochrome P450 [Apiospora arundinis]
MVIDKSSAKFSVFPDSYLAWVAVIFLVLAVKLSGIASHGSLARLPGPWYTRFTSALYTYHQIQGRAPVYVQSLHAKYGPIVRTAPHEVDVSDPTAAQTIYRIKGEFLKSPWYKTLVLGTPNIFNATDPRVHRHRRRHLSQPLSESGLRSVVPLIDKKIQLAIERMAFEMKDRGAADIYKWWLFMATDIIGLLSFGDSFEMLKKGEKNQYVMDIEATGDTFMVRTAFPSLTRWLRKLPSVLCPKSLKTANEVEDRTMQYAHNCLQRHQRHMLESPDTAIHTLFSKLYRGPTTGGNESALTPLELTVDAQAYIIGGSDTLSKTLSYLVWAVCRTPGVQQKLVREIQQRLPLPGQTSFTDAQVRELPYLAMVIEETLRLYPAVPAALPRIVPPDAPELCGQRLPVGTIVTTSAYCLHRDPVAFSEPERFWPERWQNPTKSMKDAFLPFGGGSRVCLGLHLARLEIRLAAARFFHSFPNVEISNLEGMSDDDMEPQWYFVLTPKGKRCLIQQVGV